MIQLPLSSVQLRRSRALQRCQLTLGRLAWPHAGSLRPLAWRARPVHSRRHMVAGGACRPEHSPGRCHGWTLGRVCGRSLQMTCAHTHLTLAVCPSQSRHPRTSPCVTWRAGVSWGKSVAPRTDPAPRRYGLSLCRRSRLGPEHGVRLSRRRLTGLSLAGSGNWVPESAYRQVPRPGPSLGNLYRGDERGHWPRPTWRGLKRKGALTC